MARSFCIDLSQLEQAQLLVIARRSIESGLRGGNALRLDIESLSDSLAPQMAAFVTLTKSRALRGCIGSLEASEPLAQAVASAAFNAAFHDSRFAPLDATEIDTTLIEISLLSEPEPLDATDRKDLLAKLNPQEDGLLLEDARYRSTFLPKMWEKINDPEDFLNHLLAKAGLPGDYWSESICFKRYQALSFGE